MIGVWSKWVGMIACDDVEMNGREKDRICWMSGFVEYMKTIITV